jgi:hypothetical protein
VAAQRKETIELKKDEGILKDAKGTLAEIHRLAHDIQIHTLDDEPERFVNPEDVARWFLGGALYRLAKAELAEWVESNQEADDPRGEPGPYGRRLLEDLDTFDLLADWMRVFADHMRDKVQEELKKEEKGG